ncbi:MAG: ABC transporter substrate-binding protein [Thermoanaerobaculia bacterium]|nr:ABC transporter substrate-binding protein [Thermoanaerobaculia bacterium]
MNRRSFLAALAVLPWSRALLGEAATPKVHVFGRLPAPERVRRVFAAGPPAAVLAHVLAPEKLLGWPQELSAEARAWLAPGVRDQPFLGRLAGRGSTMPLEKLLALEPDLILDTGTVDATYLSTAEDVQARTGLPYVLLPGRLIDSAWQLLEAGRMLGVPARGEQLARAAEARLDQARARRDQAATRVPKVYLARGADGLETALAGSINAEALELSGGVNIATGPGGNIARFSLEQLFAWAPEVVLTQDAKFHAHALADASWRRLPALSNGRFHLAPSLPFGWLDGPPGVNRLISLPWLASRLHGAATDADRAAEAQAFHRLFYGYAPELSAFEKLLVNA